MIRYGIIVVIIAATASAIDKTVFKNCSEIAFCSRLRNNEVDDKAKYSAEIKNTTTSNNTITIPLTNQNGDNLNLLISLLEDNKIRAKIQEHKSSRYELGDIIIMENLKELDFIQKQDGAGLSIVPKDSSYPYKVIVTPGPPFTVQFYHENILEVVLDAKRLIMENTKDSQAFTFDVNFPGAERLYGLHDHAWKMSLGDTNNGSKNTMDPFRLRNSDSWGYEANSPMALYGSIPVIYGHSNKKTAGIFLHNAAEQWIDSSSSNEDPSAYFIVERAAFDLFVLLGPTPKKIVRQFTRLTGKAHLPQIWALGYHQCRFSYKSQDDVKNVVALLDQNNFPWDAIWLDGDHTDDYRWFHWNKTTYSDPKELQKNISATGRVCVSISDPHIAVDYTYDVYIGGKEKYFTKWENGSDYEADCWPGLSSWIDYMNPAASDYYAGWFSYEKFNGSTPTLAGIWNDMNEPAVFDDSTEKTMPWELVHHGGARHGDIHNIYGFTQTRSTHKGLMDRDNKEKRPFILTRSHFAGSQRFAAMWTGDNSATWEHFANTYSECMTASVMGMVFCGADIGGFIGDPSDELLQRWYQGAAWLTFFRGHSSRESKRREPYLFSDDVQQVLREALRLRYKHIPSFYTLFFEHTRTGDPIVRPLYYQYPEVYDRDTQILVGTDIMAVAVTEPDVNAVEVFFPGNNNDVWYKIDDKSWVIYNAGKSLNITVDINSSPVFYRAGSIIFRKDLIRKSAVAAKDDPYTLYVNLNENNESSGRLYVDDYYSFNYENKQNYLYVNVEYISKTGELEITIIDGDNTGIDANIGSVIVNELPSAKTGKITAKRTVYKETSGGVPLASINIGEALRQENSNKLFIKL